MILFAVYAVIIWYLALRFRRRWQAFAIVPIASISVYVLVPLMRHVNVADIGLYILLGAEAVVILIVGLFIAILPRPPAHPHCHYCKYDMRGLQGRGPDQRCPECGMPSDGYASVRRQRAKVFATARNVQPVNGRNLAAELRTLAAVKTQQVADSGETVADLKPPVSPSSS